MGEFGAQPVDLRDVIAQAGEVLALSAQELGADDLHPDLRAGIFQLDAALSRAREALTDLLAAAQEDNSGGATFPAALLMRAEQVQLALRDALLATQRNEIGSAQTAVNRLRAAASTSVLAEQIPAEIHRMGFTRALFSYIRHGRWIACSACAGEDRELESAMIEAHPRSLAGPLLEGEMVRRGQPILVRNPAASPRVHSELVAITRTAGYVAAPVYCWGRPIGLVHADRHSDSVMGVEEFDRDALGVFAESLGIVFERNMMLERLRAVRRAADEHLRVASALADDFTLEVLDLAGQAPAAVESEINNVPAPADCGPDADAFSRLTSRESEILQSIASGKTNAQIAAALFVTEGTVKSHVKHILRKLGASNRTEAVAKYHRVKTGWPPVSF